MTMRPWDELSDDERNRITPAVWDLAESWRGRASSRYARDNYEAIRAALGDGEPSDLAKEFVKRYDATK